MAIAIDFGTSNTVISRWNSVTQTAETVKVTGYSVSQANNPPLIPSLVYVENAQLEQVVIGQTVRDRGLDLAQDTRFFSHFKRGIGTPIQGFLPQLDGVTIRFEQIGTWFLNHLLKEINLEESLIVTVPVDSFETYRHWLGQVCQTWSVDKVRIIDEPTAAALGYGVGDQNLVLVVDFGGGTLDLSLVQLKGNEVKSENRSDNPLGFVLKWGEKSFAEKSSQQAKIAQVIAKAGLNLGGSDLDHWITDELIAQYGLIQSLSLTRLAEKLKIQLSSRPTATEVYFDRSSLESYDLKLTRKQFQSILEDRNFFSQLDAIMDQVLQQAARQGVNKSQIDSVLLVGGTCQIPAVQDWVKGYFDEKQVRCDKPFEAIAHGALQLVQGIELKDFLYHSYGIRYWNRRTKSHGWHPIIQEGQAYPMSKPVELMLGASGENQPRIELVLGELGAERGGTEIYFDGDRLITRILSGDKRSVTPLNDTESARTIANLNPPGIPGNDRIRVLFQVDGERFLRITVDDLLTNQTLLNNQVVVQLS
ncbi:Hsp70 family protein [Roseofilum sp. BLCC_M154]|uniref:Hsp70 family protein n=1 Tax=Roseofilum acuticapitatum BLCC-M154 TaxID=3022444 RepID=A0ABT7B023_9CYAN|nr:Hsp70 family protein [Roseofilum acuticapitatum]MDJ1171668.1 Hsp70 family protein [Roseofilum acuticapitatum BLCC-M154]